jgi:hypothetical protein
MLILNRGQSAQFKFIFVSEGNIYDPTSTSTPNDIYFSVIRGVNGAGPIIDGPFSFLNQEETPTTSIYIEKTNGYEFTLNYVVPSNLMPGTYSVIAQTATTLENLSISSQFQIKSDAVTLSPVIISSDKSAVVNYRASYEELNQGNTNTLLLLGHADGIELNSPIRVRSVQSAIDLLRADINSPLLRGVFDAYAAGARDILICAVAPMSEYFAKVNTRNTATTIFDLSAATPASYTFYEKYYERLTETYSILLDLEFVDYIVPLEASIVNTGGVDFVTQLGNYLGDFHNNTGYVQLGIIGSRSNGISSDDVDELEANNIFTNKLTELNYDNTIASDNGRFIVPIYGEGVYQHQQLKNSYTSSVAASFAGLLSSRPLNMAMIRTRIPGITSVFGNDLTQNEYNRLEQIGVNTIYRGKKTRRAIPFEVYVTNEHTMSHPNSTLSKAAQMRLIARVVSEVRGFSYNAIGKFGYDKVVDNVRSFLAGLAENRIVLDYSFRVEVSPTQVGALIFYIELISSLGIKKLGFAISTGPGA